MPLRMFAHAVGRILPSEQMTPMSKDNCWNRNIKLKDKIGTGRVNFQVMRPTHATLTNELGVSVNELAVGGKLVADQLGHSLDLNQNVYTQSPVENRLPTVNQLEKSLFLM
jgi:integrase